MGQRRYGAVNLNDSTLFNIESAQLSPLEHIPEGNGYLFVFKVSGEMKARRGDSEKTVKNGRAVIFSLGSGRDFTDHGTTAFFTVSGRLCDILMQMHGLSDGMSVNAPLCAESFFEMVRAYSKQSVADMAYIFHGLLIKLDKALSSTVSQKTDVPQLIRDYIDANATEKVTLDKMAELFFLSKSQIFRIFKARYGIPPMQYYMEKKLEQVRRLLEGTDMRIADIAERLSFSDAKHLTKSFKSAFGELPKDYRRAFRIKNDQLFE